MILWTLQPEEEAMKVLPFLISLYTITDVVNSPLVVFFAKPRRLCFQPCPFVSWFVWKQDHVKQ